MPTLLNIYITSLPYILSYIYGIIYEFYVLSLASLLTLPDKTFDCQYLHVHDRDIYIPSTSTDTCKCNSNKNAIYLQVKLQTNTHT